MYYLLCSPVLVPQIVGGLAVPVFEPLTVKVSVLKMITTKSYEKIR